MQAATASGTKNVHIRGVPVDQWRAIRQHCLNEDMSFNEWVLAAIDSVYEKTIKNGAQ